MIKEVLHEQEGEVTTDLEKKFITSPADIEVHRKVEFQDLEITKAQQNAFKDFMYGISDIFSTDSSDIGKTSLLEIEIDTGDSLPITQKPYTLPLKHTTWVQRELENIEESWSNSEEVSHLGLVLLFVVPKRTAPGEPLNEGYVLTIEPLIVYYSL